MWTRPSVEYEMELHDGTVLYEHSGSKLENLLKVRSWAIRKIGSIFCTSGRLDSV